MGSYESLSNGLKPPELDGQRSTTSWRQAPRVTSARPITLCVANDSLACVANLQVLGGEQEERLVAQDRLHASRRSGHDEGAGAVEDIDGLAVGLCDM
ncbi:MAG: hypothetical protein ALECFALPRED_010198 [Alectoria fallacina]|uniref:Uncharacterized protein n=1 Tax=Alectoria fallacina TaxID=1903189 RepID=A0A8H3PKP6_9LECA|nr:MAG: hypothetical protein ALECFALPRED_010198 [Alectoria fallacina]